MEKQGARELGVLPAEGSGTAPTVLQQPAPGRAASQGTPCSHFPGSLLPGWIEGAGSLLPQFFSPLEADN